MDKRSLIFGTLLLGSLLAATLLALPTVARNVQDAPMRSVPEEPQDRSAAEGRTSEEEGAGGYPPGNVYTDEWTLLTAEQYEAVEEKNEYMKTAGKPYYPPWCDPVSGSEELGSENITVREHTAKISTSKDELREKAQAAFEQRRPALEEAERGEDPVRAAWAKAIRRKHAEDLREIEELPEGPIERDSRAVEVGLPEDRPPDR